MSIIGKIATPFLSSLGALSVLPSNSENQKLLISGMFSLGSVLIVELFKYLKTRKSTRLTKLNHVETDKS